MQRAPHSPRLTIDFFYIPMNLVYLLAILLTLPKLPDDCAHHHPHSHPCPARVRDPLNNCSPVPSVSTTFDLIV